MYTDWNPPTPIETLYKQLVEGQRYAVRGNKVIDDSQLVRKGYDIIKKTGLFNADCKKWRSKPEVDHTWTNFQVHFTEADDDHRKNTTTSGSAGYSTNVIESLAQQKEMNNILQEWVQAEDDTTRENQAAPIETQHTDSANATATIEDLHNEIKKMKEEMQNKCMKKCKDPPPAQGKDYNGEDITYCWSHEITRKPLCRTKWAAARNAARCVATEPEGALRR